MKHEEAQQTTSPRSYHPSGRYGADLILGTSCGGGTTLDVAKGRERRARVRPGGGPDMRSERRERSRGKLGNGVSKESDVAKFDSAELHEWLESLNYVLQSGGPEHVKELLNALYLHAYQRGVRLPFSATTPSLQSLRSLNTSDDEQTWIQGSMPWHFRIASRRFSVPWILVSKVLMGEVKLVWG